MNLGKAEKRLIVVDERAPAPAESRDQERDGHAAELAEQNADAPSATR